MIGLQFTVDGKRKDTRVEPDFVKLRRGSQGPTLVVYTH
jgi:hypothetical protein